MDKLKIKKMAVNGYALYSFKPINYIDDFLSKCFLVNGLNYDSSTKRFTAPGTQNNLDQLTKVFGKENLIWEDGDSQIKSNKEEKVGDVNNDLATKEKKPIRRSKPKGPTNRSQWPIVGKEDNGDEKSYEELHEISPHWQDALLKTEEQLMVRRYSFRTIKSYIAHLRLFFRYYPDIMLEDVDSELIKKYIVDRVRRGNYAESTQSQILNAIKFWLEQVEGRARAYVDLRPRKKSRLPKVLSFEEVLRLFKATPNLKHRCVLKTIYSGGLRLSELCNLRIADINSDRMQIFVHGGKGKKDRYTTLSQTLLEDLREYFKEYRPEYWLFEGQTGGQYSTRSVQAVLRKSVLRSGVNPFATVHTLRHSYATHLLEQGTSLRHIQELLGHQNSTTTEIYTHVSNSEKQRVISPLDRLEGLE